MSFQSVIGKCAVKSALNSISLDDSEISVGQLFGSIYLQMCHKSINVVFCEIIVSDWLTGLNLQSIDSLMEIIVHFQSTNFMSSFI